MSIFNFEKEDINLDNIDTNEFAEYYDALNSICGLDDETMKSKAAIAFHLNKFDADTGEMIDNAYISFYDPYIIINTCDEYCAFNFVFSEAKSPNMESVLAYFAKYFMVAEKIDEDNTITQSLISIAPASNVEGLMIMLTNPQVVVCNSIKPYHKENAIKVLYDLEDVNVIPLSDTADVKGVMK